MGRLSQVIQTLLRREAGNAVLEEQLADRIAKDLVLQTGGSA